MRNRLSKLHYLMFFLSMAAMTGCGANNAGTSAALNSSAAGGVAAKLQWQSGTAGSAKSQARALAAMPTGIANIQFTVTGSGANGAIPVVKSTVAASGTGQINGVYPGTVAVAVKAVDTVNNVTYEGFAVNVDVAAGKTTNVGTIIMTQSIVKAEETTCLGCHETALDATGQNIVANYKALQDGAVSSHYQGLVGADGTAGGCVGCHGSSHNTPDPSAFGTTRASNGPTTGLASTRCYDCHVGGQRLPAGTVTNHDTYYVANNTSCTACHNMHNSRAGLDERADWAQSAHGETTFAAMNHNTGTCARCHNGSGFISALAAPTVTTNGTGAQQMITCDSCHTNTSTAFGKLRALAGTTGNPFATYTTSTKGYQFAPNNILNPNKKAYYPDVAGSNLCVVCHSGSREGSTTTKAFSDPNFVNYSTMKTVAPHNLPAAATMYVKFGFTNLSTGTNGAPTQSYLDSLTSDLDSATGKVTSTHRKFGTSQINPDSHFMGSKTAPKPAPANFLTNGPCAVCHLSGSHSLKIDQKAINAVCSNCHTQEGSTTGLHTFSTEADFATYFLEPNKEAYNDAFALAAAVLNKKATAAGLTKIIFYTNPTSGKFSIGDPTVLVDSKGVALPAGTYGSYTGDLRALAVSLGYTTSVSHNNVANANALAQEKFIGALSNLIFLSEDQGGFAHARTYVRRLIYDSIDFLDDSKLNRSVSATATGVTSMTAVRNGVATTVTAPYTKGATAYTDSTLGTIATGTSEDMLFLVGWSRTDGSWASPERP